MKRPAQSPLRCPWAGSEAAMVAYHDEEWGVPSRDERHLFEMITLEGAQAGLSWRTILNKREGYRRAFAEFDPARVARFTARDVARLVKDASIVRHRGKIESVIHNARALVKLASHGESLAGICWSVVNGKPLVNRPRRMKDVPAVTPEAVALSRLLKKFGFRFVGPTTCYAFMQAVGIVNDHLDTCPCRRSSTKG